MVILLEKSGTWFRCRFTVSVCDTKMNKVEMATDPDACFLCALILSMLKQINIIRSVYLVGFIL